MVSRSSEASNLAKSGQPRGDSRPWIYAGLDAFLAALWVALGQVVLPNRHAWVSAVVFGIAALYGVAALACAAGCTHAMRERRRRWAWAVAVAACAALVATWVAWVIVLVSTAGFLAGVYGGFGQAAAGMTVIAGALAMQLIALLPGLQLKFLLSRAGRLSFGRGDAP